MKIVTVCLIYLVCFNNPLHANNKAAIYSLLHEIQITKNDSLVVRNYIGLIDQYTNQIEDGAIVKAYFNKARIICNQKSLKASEAELYHFYGKYLKTINEYDSAIYYQKTACSRAKEIGYQKLEAKCNTNLGNLYNNQGKYTDAINYYLNAIRIFDTLNMPKEASSVMMSIGNIYADNHNPTKALSYYNQSLAIKKEINDEAGVINNEINIGGIYFDNGEYDRALTTFLNVYEKAKSLNSKKALKVSTNNIGECYGKLKQFDKALSYFFISLALKKEDNDLEEIAGTQLNIGDALSSKKEFDKAELYFDSVVTSAKKIRSNEMLFFAYDAMADNYADKGDTVQAFVYTKLAEANKDTLFNKESFAKIAELETKYQAQSKDLKILKDELEIKKKQTLVYFLGGLLALFILMGVIIYYRNKTKQQREFDKQILWQQELRYKAVLEAEEKERVRIARDLHDGVGQLLSAVKMNLSAFEIGQKEIKERETIKQIIRMVDDGVKEVRLVSHSLVPNALIKQGLVSAIRDFIHSLNNTVKIELEVVGLKEKIDSNIEIALYRALQEIVNNIIKHAKATNITIQLIEHEQQIALLVEDNGIGFDTEKLNNFEGIGLKNIISRIEYIGGTVNFDSFIGKGTTVDIEVPTSNPRPN